MKCNTRKPLFVASFVRRYWKLLLFLSALEMVRRLDVVLYAWGPLFFVFELVTGAAVAALLLRNLFMRDTLDAYVHKCDGVSQFSRDWQALSPELKIILSMAVLLTFFLGAAIIAASIAK